MPVRFRNLDFHVLKIKVEKILNSVSQGLSIQRAVVLLCILVFAVCAGFLVFRVWILPWRLDAEMAEARSLYQSSAGSSAPRTDAQRASEAGKKESAPSSFSELKTINPDVVGWITLPDTAIDYPVLLAPADSPDYYLTHDWQLNETKYGSIFMLQSGPVAAGRKNAILYGHSMKDGRMFAALLKYESLSFYRSHPVVLFQEGDREAAWKIFAVIKVNTEPSQGQPFDYQKPSFSSDDEFLDYLYQVRIRSIFDLPVDLSPSDRILTLSTCSYEFSGFRTVVFARQVRGSESADVDTDKAAKNKKVLYPDCWYQRFGGKKPALPTFQEARKSNGLPWLTK